MNLDRDSKAYKIVSSKMEKIRVAISDLHYNKDDIKKAAFVKHSLDNQVEGTAFSIGANTSSLCWMWIYAVVALAFSATTTGLTLMQGLIVIVACLFLTIFYIVRIYRLLIAAGAYKHMLSDPEDWVDEFSAMHYYAKVKNG